VVRYTSLIKAMQEVVSDDLQTMVGASKDERALSKASFAVRKRLPWLQINLLTAFLAAAVVGLFEDTIAQVTALAVLLPVVAGQSGNAGAQALAVTMRGLALREITLRDWIRVTSKEVQVGFVNGLAIAVTCGLGVFLWSGSLGLVVVIALSMVRRSPEFTSTLPIERGLLWSGAWRRAVSGMDSSLVILASSRRPSGNPLPPPPVVPGVSPFTAWTSTG
jgi:Mg/Co/Ni transporter MgtE